jgi:hypothetical protein
MDMTGGRYSRQPAGPALGPELIVNGDMSSDVGWTLGGDAPPVIAGGKMTMTSPDGSGGEADQIPSLSAATYRLVYTIDSITGDGAKVAPMVGNTSATERAAAGTYTQDLACDGTDNFQLFFSSSGLDEAVTVVDNVSLRQVL